MRIFLVRHGETDWNTQRRIQGSSDFSKLNAQGIEQSKILRERLQGRYDAAHSSILQRSVQTAEIITGGRAVQTHKGLVERYFGEWTGQWWADIEKAQPDLVRKYREVSDLTGVKNAERLEDFQSRVWKAFSDIVKKDRGKDIVIVLHGLTIKAILAIILEMPLQNIGRIKQSNGCVNELEYDEKDGRFTVRGVNTVYERPP